MTATGHRRRSGNCGPVVRGCPASGRSTRQLCPAKHCSPAHSIPWQPVGRRQQWPINDRLCAAILLRQAERGCAGWPSGLQRWPPGAAASNAEWRQSAALGRACLTQQHAGTEELRGAGRGIQPRWCRSAGRPGRGQRFSLGSRHCTDGWGQPQQRPR